MSRISNILLRARDTLADPNGDRWSDDRLLRLLDEAQKDICRRAKLLRTSADVYIFANVATIDLPEDLLLLDRVLFKGDFVPLASHLEMDKISNNWETDTGTIVSKIIYDKQSRHKIKVYPILTDVDVETYINTSEYGFLTDISGLTNDSEYGVLTELTQGGVTEIFNTPYGITTEIVEASTVLTVYYLKKPTEINSVTLSTLEIDDIFDSALKYFIVGKALRDDMDTQNRVVGNEELGFYDRELKEAIKDDSMDFTRANTQYTVQYQGGI